MEQQKSMSHVSPFLVFFLICSTQVGVGVLGFPRYIAQDAGYRAWISVLITGALIHIVIWMMYKLLNRSDKLNDLTKIHRFYFGKTLGGIMSFLFTLYFFTAALTVLRTYIEVIQIWMFPRLFTVELGIPIVLISLYCIWYGFRVVTGLAYLGVIVPLILLTTIVAPLEFAEVDNLLPLFHTNIGDQLTAIRTMTLSYVGVEALLIYYPFIQNGVKSQKWAQFGNLFTTAIYLLITIVTFLFYTENHLERVIYPTLSMWKILELPFIERFEYIGISFWLIVVLPNITLFLWAASRTMKQTFQVTHKTALIFLAVLLILLLIPLDTRQKVDMLNDHVATTGFYIIYVYLPTLFIVTAMIHKWRNRSNEDQQTSM
ncbi:GerAB/ArcD/ProY family transporter [Evansella halocellulosilytica]|uniref:GerAB/ArcD/ProY family transporter n=1 Tax=Evansella halocellulosilytica TaxID=2011013 RepID=UPI000BB861C4|nr:GerAB/ArcD/ProY family transporter [Evansella halocellulosilytica]